MSDAMVLDKQKRTASFYGLMLAAAASGIGSFWLAMAPPILQNAQTTAEIAAAQSQGLSYSAPAKVGWAKALSLVLGGASLTAGLAATHVASSRPKTLTTPVLNRIANPETPEKLADLDDKAHAHQGQVVVSKVMQMFIDHPWLEDVCDIDGSKMDLLIIIGEPGKGKSTLAQSIGVLRKVLNNSPIFIFDEQANVNVSKGTWVSGEIAGITDDAEEGHPDLAGDWGHLPYKTQHMRMTEVMKRKLKTNELESATAIYDELKQLSVHGFTTEEIDNFYSDYTSYRKRGDKAIYLWHGETKGTNGMNKLSSDNSLLTALLNYAAVIDFNAAPSPKRSRRDKEKNSDRAMFKPAGERYSKENMELITIPKLMFPPTLMSLLGSAAEYFDIRLSGHRDPGLADRRREMKSKIERRFKGTEQDHDGSFRSSLETLIASPLTQHYLNNPVVEKEVEDGLSAEGLPSRSLFVDLLNYIEDPTTSTTPAEESGYFSLSKIQSNWGRKEVKGRLRFNDVAALRHFLSLYNASGFGEWGNEKQTVWKPRVHASDFN